MGCRDLFLAMLWGLRCGPSRICWSDRSSELRFCADEYGGKKAEARITMLKKDFNIRFNNL